jgi:hypothetical protein
MNTTQERTMSPNVRQSRAGQPFSFRPTESILNDKLPQLCDLWGEERTRVISRAMQIAWDHLDTIQPAEELGVKGSPVNYRPSAFEEEVIMPDLMRKLGADRSTAICQAIDFAYYQEMERRGIS